MMGTGEKQTANSKGMDDAVSPQRLPKMLDLSMSETEMPE